MATDEREIVRPVALARASGRLSADAIGFARRAVHDARLHGPWGRRKRWDYWCVTSPHGALQLTIANLDYLGLVEIAWVDFATGEVASVPHVVPLAVGIHLPDGVEAAPIVVRAPHLRASVTPGTTGTRIQLRGRAPRGRIEADVLVAPTEESLNVVVPWDAHHYQLTSKHVARPAHGRIEVLGRELVLDARESFGGLDYGRGVWPRDVTWNWGTAAAHVPHVGRVGLQLGGTWTDGTGATENGVFLDGRLDKIGAELRWRYDRHDFTRPWRVEDEHGDVALDFVPQVLRRSRVELGIGKSVLHLAFGRWSGRVHAHGREIELRDAIGWAEEHVARW